MSSRVIEYVIAARDKTASAVRSATSAVKGFGASVARNLMNVKAGFDMLSGVARSFAGVFQKAIGEAFKMEKAVADFRVLLKSADAAKEHIAELKQFASSTPLTFDDLARASKLLLSFGADAESIMPTLKTLGDVSMGDAQKFQGLALVFAQVQSAGKLMGQDLLQMINQGFNPRTGSRSRKIRRRNRRSRNPRRRRPRGRAPRIRRKRGRIMAWGTTGAEVALSKDSSATVLFAKSGQTTVKQNETVETTEWRGLTESAAKNKCVATAFSSDYAETTWYKAVDGEARHFTAVTGKRTEWSASRADESGQWTATRRVTTYSVSPAPGDNGWSTTAVSAASESSSTPVSERTWNTVSKDVSSSHVYASGDVVIYSTNTVTVQELRYLTESDAESCLTTSTQILPTRFNCYATSGSSSTWTAYATINIGTEIHSSKSFVSADEGWTVTKTTTVYGWGQSGNTSSKYWVQSS